MSNFCLRDLFPPVTIYRTVSPFTLICRSPTHSLLCLLSLFASLTIFFPYRTSVTLPLILFLTNFICHNLYIFPFCFFFSLSLSLFHSLLFAIPVLSLSLSISLSLSLSLFPYMLSPPFYCPLYFPLLSLPLISNILRLSLSSHLYLRPQHLIPMLSLFVLSREM